MGYCYDNVQNVHLGFVLRRTRAHRVPCAASTDAMQRVQLAYPVGLCSAAGEAAQPFAEGRTLGSLSMTSYLLGMQPPLAGTRSDDVQSMPSGVLP